MDRDQFSRFMNRVGKTLEYVPDQHESELMLQLRRSFVSHPARLAKVQLALELNKLFLFLGEHKTAYLMQLCELAHIQLDENMTKPDADRLWEYLETMYEEWNSDGIQC